MAQTNRTPSPSPRDLYYDQARLQMISLMLCSKLDDLFSALGVGLGKTSRMYYGCCPVHGGDRPDAFNLYVGGDIPGKWVCRSRHCEERFRKTIIGFVRGMLSRNKYGWSDEQGRQATFAEAVDWCCKFLGQSLASLQVDHSELEKRRYATHASLLIGRETTGKRPSLTRADVRSRLKIPAQYFISRGWSPEVLDRYDVGLCEDAGKPMCCRVVVPVYDDEYRYCLGVTGRSIHPKCNVCKCYHPEKEKCPERKQDHPKWRNSDSLSVESHLYNYWFASKAITRDNLAVLVEGPGDLWRLVEAGVEHGLAMFGSHLTDQQQFLLEKSGAMTLIVLTNMDKAGRDCAERIRKDLHRSYRLHFPELPKKDLGEMTPQEVREVVHPIIDRTRR